MPITTRAATLLAALTIIVIAVAATATASASGDALAISGPEAPAVLENATDVASYTANAPDEATAAWSLEGPDKDLLKIAQGTLTFAAPPNYESPADHDSNNIYEVTVQASATGPNAGTAELAVQITVQDVNEPAAAVPPVTVELNVGTTTIANLTTWFQDPEGDTLSFSISTHRDDALNAAIHGDHLTLTASGEKRRTSLTIQATDGHGTTSLTTPISITRDSIPGFPPSEVRNLQAQPAEDGFNLTWDTPTYNSYGTTTHFVAYRPHGTNDRYAGEETHTHSRYHRITGLQPNTTYDLAVSACKPRHPSLFLLLCSPYAFITAPPSEARTPLQTLEPRPSGKP